MSAKPGTSRQKIIALAMGLVALAALGVAFANIGSPAENRLRVLDEKRVSDLSYLEGCLNNYWYQKKDLPIGLSQLNDERYCVGEMSRRDPLSGEPYEYKRLEANKFEFCAVFSRAGGDQQDYYYSAPLPASSWYHLAGRHCFEREFKDELIKGIAPPLVPPPRFD